VIRCRHASMAYHAWIQPDAIRYDASFSRPDLAIAIKRLGDFVKGVLTDANEASESEGSCQRVTFKNNRPVESKQSVDDTNSKGCTRLSKRCVVI